MKKAYLVNFSITTRVILDINEDLTVDEQFEPIVIGARENILKNGVESYLIGDNAEVDEDLECPYETGEGE